MDNALQETVKKEVDRKVRESEAANSLPANLSQPVENGNTKASADEVTPSPDSLDAPKEKQAAQADDATKESDEEFVSPSKPLGTPRKKKDEDSDIATPYVSPSQPLSEAPAEKIRRISRSVLSQARLWLLLSVGPKVIKRFQRSSKMRKLLPCTAIIALSLCISAGASEDVPMIQHAELVQAIKAKSVVLLDCNSKDTYASGHIPGAIHLASAGDDLASKLPADKSAFIVVYCGSDHCPAWEKGAQALSKLGYTNFKHYAPGIKGWKESGEPTEPPQPGK